MEIHKVDVLSEPNTVLEIAKVYRETFGADPWNEGYLCPFCGRKFPLSVQRSFCPSCSGGRMEGLIWLVEYWTESKVISDFYLENTKQNSSCFVAEENNEVVGFVWGYGVMIDPKSAAKIEAPELAEVYRREVFYLDECAVHPDFQKRGFGKKLVRKILTEQPFDMMVLRTLDGSVMHNLISKLGGEKILSISKGRIIMKIIKPTSLHKFVVPEHY